MYDSSYDRKFGIEFEFTMPIEPMINEHGYMSKNGAFEILLSENGMSDFRVGNDGSEWEVKTPPLSGPNGFKKVKKFLDLVISRGARVQYRYDGLHVHHDAPEFVHNTEMTTRLVENWVSNQSEILKMVRRNRQTSLACPQWNDWELENLKYSKNIYSYGRKNLNVSALRRHGTIEVRLHEGTLDYNEVFSWVRFGQAFIAKALAESSDIVAANPDDLLKKINVSRNASRFITTKMLERYGIIATA